MIQPFHMRLSVKAAIAWTIIAEVVRNHGGASDLRVMEMHPGGGQYHLLRIYRVRGEDGGVYESASAPLGELNLLSGMMRGFLPGHDEDVEWLRIWLTNPDPEMLVDVAIQTFGLSVVTELPLTTRRIFGCRLMAALLGATMLNRDYIVAGMGFVDTSGYGGGVHPELRRFRSILPDPTSAGDAAQMSRAADCWLLYKGWDSKLAGVLRMDGLLSAGVEPEKAHDLFPIFERSRSMRMAVAEAREILSL
jgi:hypothetical protein